MKTKWQIVPFNYYLSSTVYYKVQRKKFLFWRTVGTNFLSAEDAYNFFLSLREVNRRITDMSEGKN